VARSWISGERCRARLHYERATRRIRNHRRYHAIRRESGMIAASGRVSPSTKNGGGLKVLEQPTPIKLRSKRVKNKSGTDEILRARSAISPGPVSQAISSPAIIPALTFATSVWRSATPFWEMTARQRQSATPHQLPKPQEVRPSSDEYVIGQEQTRRAWRSPSTTTTSAST